jgi:hypothetical protein
MRYRVEITGWNSFGESVEDSAEVEADTEDAAFESLLNRMRSYWDFTEVGDSRIAQITEAPTLEKASHTPAEWDIYRGSEGF